MTYLLDTHTFLWLLNTPEVLPEKVLKIIRDHASRVLISLVTPWEIAIKAKTGKLDAADLLVDFETKITKAKLEMLQTTVRHAVRGGSLPLHHRDPFDRLLIAQAIELQISILSNDRLFDLYGVSRIWD